MPLQELTREFAEAVARQHPALQTLSLARNALTHARFLELLPPLRRLDLSANALRALPRETAQWGPSLEFLDLSGNALESLQQLRFCSALVTLNASGNRIALFSELKYLQALEHLQELTLEGNPIARQPFYRREVVAMLPQLQRLDGRAVTPAERLVASLQQKPLLTAPETADTPPTATTTAPGPTVLDEDDATDAPNALDLSGASHAWSLRVDSPAASSSSVASSVAPSPRRPLLTPASLRRPHEPIAHPTTASVPNTVDVSVQAASSSSRESEAERDEDTNESHVGHALEASSRLQTPPKAPEALLQSRVTALESILALQDKMLADELAQLGGRQNATKDPERAARVYTQLLATWRHKVVSLMVQLRAAELSPSAGGSALGTSANAKTEAQVSRVREELGRQLELWQQKCTDALAQRDLERVRAEQAQRLCDGAESKIVRVVRTLANERERVRAIAEEVALFASKEGAMTTHMDVLVRETHRLSAFETRLRMLSERLQLASRLVAHREARLRNSEAAIEAERRVWQHKTQADRDGTDGARSAILQNRKSLLLLRPATEQALRLLFHRLDPYHTGLVATQRLLQAMATDLAIRDALGGANDAVEAKRQKLVEHIEKHVRQRSPSGGVGGTLTWGEVLLLFMPVVERLSGDDNDGEITANRDTNLLLTADDLGVPPPFEVLGGVSMNKSQRRQTKADKQALQSLSKAELIALVVSLRGDREQLQRRVMEDAQQLQRRVQGVQRLWERKTEELVRSNDELHQQVDRLTERVATSQQEAETAERASGEAQYQLQSLRRQLSEQSAMFAKQKSDLEAQRDESVAREQGVWQRELQDMAFQQTQLQSENAKLELSVRQLERELAKQRDQREQNESTRVQHLEEKLSKRDNEIAKLRRERNTILNALREHERKLAQQPAERAPIHKSDVSTQTAASSALSTRSTGVQVAQTDLIDARDPRDRRMQLEEIAPPPPPPRQTSVAPSAPTRALHADDLQRRLQHLELLTESLLAD